jgi:hypothetical protein
VWQEPSNSGYFTVNFSQLEEQMETQMQNNPAVNIGSTSDPWVFNTPQPYTYYYNTYAQARTIGQEIVDAYKAGILDRDEARKAFKRNYPYILVDETQEQ